MADQLAAIFAQIKKYNKIIIHRHQRPDPDAIGSQVGLAAILKASFPYKQVYVVGKHIPGFDWIGTMDKIDNETFDDALVIVTDTANAPRIDDRRFNNGDELIKIDHHPNDEPFGDLMWVEPDASSCSEMIYAFYQHFAKELKLPKQAASALYAGIIGDTGRFLYPATTPRTMLVAGALMAAGADASAISQRENEITLPLARLSAYVYEHLTILEHGAAYVVLTNDLLAKFGLSVEQEDGHYRIRLRSKGPSINGLAKNHDGGGHALASGAKAKDQDEIKQVIAELDQLTAAYATK